MSLLNNLPASTPGMFGNMYIDFLRRLSKQRLLMHLLFWIAVTIFCFFVFRNRSVTRTLQTNLGFLPGHMLFVYSLNYFLFPRYVLKGRIFAALAGFLVILAVSLFFMRVADVYIVGYSGATSLFGPYNYARVVYALFSIGWIAVTIRLVKYWYIEQETQHRLEKEKLSVELRLLHSQLHPHFLFNTLNSLYAMTLERSAAAPEAVLRLSGLLRYILYECDPPLVPLPKEIEMIKYYIALEQMRFGNRLEIGLSFTGELANRHVAPLLFLPFVENSIKHGVNEQLEKCWISLHIHVEDNALTFKLINSHALAMGHTGGDGNIPARSPGLGLLNARRRLDLLYPGRYTLTLVPEEDTFMVCLKLAIHEAEMPVGR